jgi:hypothetical protein
MTKSQDVTFRLPGGGTIRMSADTEASLLTDPQSLMLLPGKKTSTYSIILRRGPVEVDLPDRNPPVLAVAVGTPSDTRVVTLSGRMRLRADGRNVVAVSYSGLTTVTQGSRFARLPNGIKRVYTGKSGTIEHELLPATPWVGGRRVWLATREDVKISGYTWGAVAGAAGYDVALTELSTGKTLARTYVTDPMFEGGDVIASPGRFELRIAAVDREGFVSPVHRQVELRVVGLSLPPLAEVQKNDTVVLGADQQVSLLHAEGLTLTTADHRGNVPASSSFGLERQDRASILIHPPGGGDPSTLTLVRRENLVTAWVGPKTVTWPLDPVELRVELVDHRGTPLSPRIEPVAKVMLGIEPMQVDWVKEGNSWRALLPAQTGQGPWVVRLEVVDQYGGLIGRDFVEVARSQPPRKKSLVPAATNDFDWSTY